MALWYCGITIGPAGAFGLWNGSVAIHAANAGRYSGRKRFTKIAAAFSSPIVVDWSQKSKVVVS